MEKTEDILLLLDIQVNHHSNLHNSAFCEIRVCRKLEAGSGLARRNSKLSKFATLTISDSDRLISDSGSDSLSVVGLVSPLLGLGEAVLTPDIEAED